MDKNDKYTKKWILPTAILYVVLIGIAVLFVVGLSSCSPKIVEKIVTQIEYRDRVVHDTAKVEILKEVERVVTRDTSSHLENDYGKSDAVVSDGMLHHSLETKPQIIKVPVEVHVTDTIVKEAEINTVTEYVEKPLSKLKSFKIDAFWCLVGIIALLLVWTFRKLIFRI